LRREAAPTAAVEARGRLRPRERERQRRSGAGGLRRWRGACGQTRRSWAGPEPGPAQGNSTGPEPVWGSSTAPARTRRRSSSRQAGRDRGGLDRAFPRDLVGSSRARRPDRGEKGGGGVGRGGRGKEMRFGGADAAEPSPCAARSGLSQRRAAAQHEVRPPFFSVSDRWGFATPCTGFILQSYFRFGTRGRRYCSGAGLPAVGFWPSWELRAFLLRSPVSHDWFLA
jgi:hypothetical protein